MAKEMNTEKKVEALLAPIIEANSFELADVEFVKEGQNWYLRIYIDKDGGVTIDDCEIVSRAIEKIIDEKDPIEQAYILEVSSPGIDRPLKKEADFVKYAGEVVDVKLYKAINKQKEFQGRLKGLENTIVTIIDDEGGELSFERKDIAAIRLAVLF
ncbi:MAG TPA: ribosome maturation factor RimP [Lachnospiraceae bacterium]|nr:ribosome maturation factor RimP [Lachnospiraceae bacterium]